MAANGRVSHSVQLLITRHCCSCFCSDANTYSSEHFSRPRAGQSQSATQLKVLNFATERGGGQIHSASRSKTARRKEEKAQVLPPPPAETGERPATRRGIVTPGVYNMLYCPRLRLAHVSWVCIQDRFCGLGNTCQHYILKRLMANS